MVMWGSKNNPNLASKARRVDVVRLHSSARARPIEGKDCEIRADCSYRNGSISAAHARILLQVVAYPTAYCRSPRTLTYPLRVHAFGERVGVSPRYFVVCGKCCLPLVKKEAKIPIF